MGYFSLQTRLSRSLLISRYSVWLLSDSAMVCLSIR